MTEGRADKHGMSLPWQRKVIGKSASAGQQGNILETGPGLGLAETSISCRSRGRRRFRLLSFAPAPPHVPSVQRIYLHGPTACEHEPLCRSGNAVFRPCIGVQADRCMLTVCWRY
jgi:hypothetical protein